MDKSPLLGPDGQPLNLDRRLAVDAFREAAPDTYRDQVWINWLVKNISRISPDIEPVFYAHTQTIAFWYNGVIIYKVTLDNFNENELSLEGHVKRAEIAFYMVKNNPELMARLKRAMATNNKKIGKNIS